MEPHGTIRASDATTEDWGKLTANPWYTAMRIHDHAWRDDGWDIHVRIATSNTLCQSMYEISMEKIRQEAGIR